jgi:glycosyltransferase 2 family protein
VKEKLKNLWPYAISLVLLVVLFSRIDYKDTWEAIKIADVSYLVMAFGVLMATNFMIWWRWMIIMKALNLKFKRLNTLRWFFLGQFLNMVLPSSVGGDLFRGLGLAKETGNKSKVFASIVLDRLIGFVAIVLVASLAFFFGRKIVNDPVIAVSIICMVTGSMTIAIVLFSHRIFSWVCKAFKRWPKIKDSLMNLHYDLVLMKGKYKQAIATVMLSSMAQVIFAFEFYLIAKAMHLDVPFVYFVVFSPMVCVVTSLPSIGGLGVREFGWVSLLSLLGVAKGTALGLSLISFFLMVISGVLGGLFYVATLSSRRVQHHQADVHLKPGNA